MSCEDFFKSEDCEMPKYAIDIITDIIISLGSTLKDAVIDSEFDNLNISISDSIKWENLLISYEHDYNGIAFLLSGIDGYSNSIELGYISLADQNYDNGLENIKVTSYGKNIPYEKLKDILKRIVDFCYKFIVNRDNVLPKGLMYVAPYNKDTDTISMHICNNDDFYKFLSDGEGFIVNY